MAAPEHVVCGVSLCDRDNDYVPGVESTDRHISRLSVRVNTILVGKHFLFMTAMQCDIHRSETLLALALKFEIYQEVQLPLAIYLTSCKEHFHKLLQIVIVCKLYKQFVKYTKYILQLVIVCKIRRSSGAVNMLQEQQDEY